jgi:DNA-binding IclR family transcriptional regulator
VQPPSDHIQSVSRALRILEVVGASPGGLSPKAIARGCDLRLSTTYHLVRTLDYEGYLGRLPTGDYVLGLEIADRFRDLMANLARPPQVAQVLRRVAEVTSHSAYLARFVDGRITIAHVVEAPHSPPLEDLIPGFDEGAHATALGKALLSTLAPAVRRAYLAEAGLRPFTPATVTDADALDAELEGGHEGVFTEFGQYRDEVACGAVLVATGEDADPWWALGVSASAAVFARERPALTGELGAAAAALTA